MNECAIGSHGLVHGVGCAKWKWEADTAWVPDKTSRFYLRWNDTNPCTCGGAPLPTDTDDGGTT